MPRPGRFTPRTDSVPIAQEAGWTPGLVSSGAKNLAPPSGIRSPVRSSPQLAPILLPLYFINCQCENRVKHTQFYHKHNEPCFIKGLHISALSGHHKHVYQQKIYCLYTKMVALHYTLIILTTGHHTDPTRIQINPLKPELNPICYLLALLAHHFLHVSRIRVKSLTFRRLMSYKYIWSTHS